MPLRETDAFTSFQHLAKSPPEVLCFLDAFTLNFFEAKGKTVSTCVEVIKETNNICWTSDIELGPLEGGTDEQLKTDVCTGLKTGDFAHSVVSLYSG